MKFVEEVVSLIKEKPELSPLDDFFVTLVVEDLIVPSNKEYVSFEQFKRSRQCRELVSASRKKLRDVYGLFLHKPITDADMDIFDQNRVLSLHKSAQERLLFYEQAYNTIFKKLADLGLKEEYSLIDIACGYNPLAYSFLPIKPKSYFAVDLSSQDMCHIQSFFDRNGLNGEAMAFDVLGTKFEKYISSREFDVCFLFKALDPFELTKRNSSKRLLTALNVRYFVVSFSLFSIGGKTPIAVSKRAWFEKFVRKQGWIYESFEIPNELFFIVSTKIP